MCDSFVLGSQKGSESWAVVAAVRFGPEAEFVGGESVGWEFSEPDLEELPEGVGGVVGGVGGLGCLAAGEGADEVGKVVESRGFVFGDGAEGDVSGVEV